MMNVELKGSVTDIYFRFIQFSLGVYDGKEFLDGSALKDLNWAAFYEFAKKQTLVGSVGHGEAIAQRKDTVEGIADMELAHLAGTVANTGDKEPKFVGLGIKIVNGYRTTQKSIGRLFYLHLNKLTRRHRRHGVLRSQLDEYVLLVEVVDGTYGQVQASLLHK